MDNNKISIIVPVYNVEKYLDKCVESLINQTYKNLEIILIDDGSPDNSPELCDEWAKKDSRIKVIHKENGGVSSARNKGLDVATGDYIGFIDSDDFIDPTMYEKLMNVIIENNAEVAKCMFSRIDENNNITKITETNINKINSKNIFSYFVKDNVYYINGNMYRESVSLNIVSCLYSKNIIGDTRFYENFSMGEDLTFSVNILNKSPKMAIVNECLYYYFNRSDSAVNLVNEKQLSNQIKYFKTVIDMISDKITKEEFKSYKFLLYKAFIFDLVKVQDKKVFKKYLKEINGLGLNEKQNFKEYQRRSHKFTKKLANFLVHHKCLWLLKLLIKVRGN